MLSAIRWVIAEEVETWDMREWGLQVKNGRDGVFRLYDLRELSYKSPFSETNLRREIGNPVAKLTLGRNWSQPIRRRAFGARQVGPYKLPELANPPILPLLSGQHFVPMREKALPTVRPNLSAMTFTAPLACFDHHVWGHYLPVSAEQAAPFVDGENRRVICTLDGTHRMHAALMLREGVFFVLVNQQVRDQLGLGIGDPVEVSLEQDPSPYGLPMPDELLMVFQQEPEADRLFHALTPGKQRSLIYLVRKVKHTDSRIAKALAIATHLQEARGQLDFKALNQWIKHYNQRKGT